MNRRIGFALAVIIFLASSALAQQINFAWDPHEEAAAITGFHLWQTKPVVAGTPAQVATFTPGSLTSGSVPKPGLGTYCWVLTAYINEPGTQTPLDSDNSNEVCAKLKPKPPKLNSVVQALVKAGRKLLALFGHKNLRITSGA